MFATTTVAPTGVENRIEAKIPAKAAVTAITAEQTITPLKLLNTCIADNAGNTIKADVNKAPTKFIAKTMITAVIRAIIKLQISVLIPVAFEKVSSKVTAKILLYKNTNTAITTMDIATQIITSLLPKVKIEVDPNKVLHTSPAMLAEVEKVFNNK